VPATLRLSNGGAFILGGVAPLGRFGVTAPPGVDLSCTVTVHRRVPRAPFAGVAGSLLHGFGPLATCPTLAWFLLLND